MQLDEQSAIYPLPVQVVSVLAAMNQTGAAGLMRCAGFSFPRDSFDKMAHQLTCAADPKDWARQLLSVIGRALR